MKRRSHIRAIFSTLSLAFFLSLCFVMIGSQENKVFADSTQCDVILSIDRSGSISDRQWQIMGENIRQLIISGVLGVDNVNIAIWTFSHGDSSADYNWPHSSGYIRAGITGNVNQQDTLIRTIFGVDDFRNGSVSQYTARDGGTDYQQAFGYSSDFYIGGAPKLNNSIRSIASGSPDAFILITDGAPNYPGGINGNSGLDNNPAAMSAGRGARSMYPIPAYGAFVTEPQSSTVPVGLSYTMNGPRDDVGPVKYGGIAGFIDERIFDACHDKTPPRAYSLEPTITASSQGANPNEVIERAATALHTSVDNITASSTTSSQTDWKIMQIVVPAGDNSYINATNYGKYKDDDGSDSCAWIVARGISGDCSLVRFDDGANASEKPFIHQV